MVVLLLKVSAVRLSGSFDIGKLAQRCVIIMIGFSLVIYVCLFAVVLKGTAACPSDRRVESSTRVDPHGHVFARGEGNDWYLK